MIREFLSVCRVFILSLMTGVVLAGLLTVGSVNYRGHQLAREEVSVHMAEDDFSINEDDLFSLNLLPNEIVAYND